MIKKLKILIIAIFFFTPFFVFGAIENIDNAGFVPGPIWFSKYPVFVDDEVRIYTALYNNSDYDISGELHFLNNEEFIGKTNFEMPASSGALDVWIDWTAVKGNIEVSAEIKNVLIVNSEKEAVSDIDFKEGQIAKSEIFIDYDNDNDGIGNIEDDDDDNDGVDDLTEIAEGSNPFEVDHIISTSSDETRNNKDNLEKNDNGIIDKIDDSVMNFLNKVTKNKIDKYVDGFSEKQVEKLKLKQGALEDKINYTFYESLDNITKLKTIKSTTTIDTQNPSDLIVSSEYLPSDLNRAKVKSKISTFFSNSISKVYLFFVNALIFFLSHPFFLFLLIFFIVYLSIRKIIRFFIG